MDNNLLIALLVLLVLVLLLILGFDTHKASSRVRRLVKFSTSHVEVITLGTKTVGPEGGNVHFVDEKRQIDVKYVVPAQKTARQLTFTGTTYGSLPDNPTGKLVVRALVNLDVTDANGPVTSFDPAVSVTAKYFSSDLKGEYVKEPIKLILLHHDGERWTRTPITNRNEKDMLTGLIASLVPGDGEGFGGDM